MSRLAPQKMILTDRLPFKRPASLRRSPALKGGCNGSVLMDITVTVYFFSTSPQFYPFLHFTDDRSYDRLFVFLLSHSRT
jgi:hypothetical protein